MCSRLQKDFHLLPLSVSQIIRNDLLSDVSNGLQHRFTRSVILVEFEFEFETLKRLFLLAHRVSKMFPTDLLSEVSIHV